jgi:hypothetical protein
MNMMHGNQSPTPPSARSSSPRRPDPPRTISLSLHRVGACAGLSSDLGARLSPGKAFAPCLECDVGARAPSHPRTHARRHVHAGGAAAGAGFCMYWRTGTRTGRRLVMDGNHGMELDGLVSGRWD